MFRKTILTTFATMMLLTCHAYGQEQQPTPDAETQQAAPAPGSKMTDMLADKLSLTDDQKSQIAPILADRQAQLRALREDTSMRRMQKARKAKKIMHDSDGKINAILTPDQQKKYSELEQQMRDKMREHMQDQQEMN